MCCGYEPAWICYLAGAMMTTAQIIKQLIEHVISWRKTLVFGPQMQKKNNLKRDREEIYPETNMGAVIRIDKKTENEQNNIRYSTHLYIVKD